MGFLTEHKHTEITNHLDRILSSKSYDLDAEVPELVDLIKTKNEPVYIDNQEEAARILRKKLKYGNKLQQSRSLDTLHILITSGFKLSVLYNDEKLLDRLRVIGLGTSRLQDGNGLTYSSKVIQKCSKYMVVWCQYIQQNGYSNDRCYNKLFSSCSKVKQFRLRGIGRSSGFLDDDVDTMEFDAEDAEDFDYYDNSGNRTMMTARTDPDRKYRIPKINLNKAAPKIKSTISDSLAAAVSLQNALVAMPPGSDAMDDKRATECFVQARAIRRKVLRYLQLVTEGEFLGALIHANEELVAALTKYDEMCKGEGSEEGDVNSYSSEASSGQSSGSGTRPRAGSSSSSSSSNGNHGGYGHLAVTNDATHDKHSIISYPSSTTSNPFGDQNEI